MKENIEVNVQGTYYDLILCPCDSITPVVPKSWYPKLEQESVSTVCFSKYFEDRLKNFTSPIISDMELVEISYAVGMCIYRQNPYLRFQLSAFYHGPPKIWKNQRNKWFINFKTCAKQEASVTWWNPAAQMHPALDSSSFVPIPTLPCKLATILLLAYLLFELVAALSQCFCSESPCLP